jgi:hypothetical protein
VAEDYLDKETSVSVDLTKTGVTATAKSRFVAAVDRLCGNVVDLLNVPVERRVSKGHALIKGERELIDAAVRYGIDHMNRDPDFAGRVIENQLRSLFRRQDNKDAVVMAAIEDMRNDPITPAEAEAGSPELDGKFLDRFERLAEGATDVELRQKWGRVLSAEIRKPGTFSMKVLRIVDEMEPSTALLFERLCESRLAGCLPKCLVGDLSFADATALTTAELLVEPGLGQIRQFKKIDHGKGPVWILYLNEYALAIPVSTPIHLSDLDFVNSSLTILTPGHNNEPAMPIYVLTEAGEAVAQILPNRRRDAFRRLTEKVKSVAPEVLELAIDAGGTYFPLDS